MVLLTGSNMSGKSTFLRTLGVNIVLANMGAPVFAKRLVVPHNLELFCAIRIDDSLSDATSYFYAEVKRLKVIVDSLKDRDLNKRPVLFLVDEIFRGTNNKERFIGSWHLLKSFLKQGAFGVVSTHDLALAELEKNDSRLVNMHFKEDIVAQELEFNYTLRHGPSPTTNALFIMRKEGLPIPENAELEEQENGKQSKAN